MGGEGREGKGSNATTTAIVFLCYSFNPFCVVDPLGQRVFAYNVYCIYPQLLKVYSTGALGG